MSYINRSITVQYEDNSYGKTEQKTIVFTTGPDKDKGQVLKEIEDWRYNGGYIIRNPEQINEDGFTYEHVEE